MLADLRFALRSFVRQPGATALIVATLGLAVAANVAVFSLLDGIFFRPFPFSESNRLVELNEKAPRWKLDFTGINYPDFTTWRARAHAFESMALWGEGSVNIASGVGAEVERVQSAWVTYDLAKVLRIRPLLGRPFLPEEDRPHGPKVAAIGYALWQSHFGGASNVVGKTIRIDGQPHTIVGVLPPEARFPGEAEVWLPLAGDSTLTDDFSYQWEGVARLAPGVTLDQAAKDLMEAHRPVWLGADTAHNVSPRVMALRDRFVIDYRLVGRALGLGVALVLLIACANVAGAMLARSIFRRREIGIRVAVGASAGRVARQLLTESLALAIIAGIAGAVLGEWGLRLLLASSPGIVPPWASLSVGPRTVAFAMVVVVVTAALFGLAPAFQLTRQSLAGALGGGQGGTRSAGSVPQRKLLQALVVAEVALAAVLLVSGSLLVQTYRHLRDVDPGFRPAGLASFRLSLPDGRYGDGLKQTRFYATLVDQLRQIPGVDGAGAVTCPPFGCHWGKFFKAEGTPPLGRNEQDPVTLFRFATPGYFATMGIHLVHGRFFAEREGVTAGPGGGVGFRPVVINQQLAHRLWPGVEDPTGRRLADRGDTSSRWSTVVGVVQDVRHYGLAQPMIPGLYFPMTRVDSAYTINSMAFVVHTPGDPSALYPAIRGLVRQLDPELPLYDVRTMQGALDRSTSQQRAIALCLAAFAGIALALAVGGIYAVLSYVVGRRRHEIGIRMALGADAGQVAGLVVRQGLALAGIGLALGVPAALVIAGGLAQLLVGVTPHDPATYLGVVVVLGLTSAAAAFIPARRAASVPPTTVLSDGS